MLHEAEKSFPQPEEPLSLKRAELRSLQVIKAQFPSPLVIQPLGQCSSPCASNQTWKLSARRNRAFFTAQNVCICLQLPCRIWLAFRVQVSIRNTSWMRWGLVLFSLQTQREASLAWSSWQSHRHIPRHTAGTDSPPAGQHSSQGAYCS